MYTEEEFIVLPKKLFQGREVMQTRFGAAAARAFVIVVFMASTLACSFSFGGLVLPATATSQPVVPQASSIPSLPPTLAPTLQTTTIMELSPTPQATAAPSATLPKPTATLAKTTAVPLTATLAKPTLKATQSGPATSLGGGMGPYTSLIYAEDFSPRQNGLISGWKAKAGSCTIRAEAGFLVVCGKLEAFVGDASWKDYNVTLGGITVGASVSDLTIFVRYQDASNHVKLQCNETPSGAKTWLNCEFHSVVDGADSILKGGSVPQVCDVTCSLTVKVSGSKASLVLMNQALATVTIPGPAAGGVGFRVNAVNHDWKLDDFTVAAPGFGAQPGYTLFRDTFSTLFSPSDRDNEFATVKETAKGAFQVNITAKQSVASRETADPALALKDNFYYLLTTQLDSKASDACSGITFHVVDANNLYSVCLYNSGEYDISAKIDGNWDTIQDLTSSAAILAGQPNQVAILAEGTDYSLYINGENVYQFTDDRLKGGTFGFITQLSNTGDAAVVDFSKLELYGQ